MSSLLLIDRDRNFREAMAIALRLEGCRVAATEDAAFGRLALTAGRYDLCVVDLNVAESERLLDEAAAGQVAVLLTGPHEDLLAKAAHRHPRVGVLAKPFRAAELLAQLEALPPAAGEGR
jgi:DNA-binding NtrC family response regulator